MGGTQHCLKIFFTVVLINWQAELNIRRVAHYLPAACA